MYRTKVFVFGLVLGLHSLVIAMESDVFQRISLPRTARHSDRSFQLKKAGGDWKALSVSPSEKPNAQIPFIYRARRAIERGDVYALQKILNAGEIDFTPQEGEYTSASFALLYCAASLRYPKFCKMLLRAGANPNASSIDYPEGNTILSETICLAFFPKSKQGVPELCALLIEHGAVITQRCKEMADLAGGGFF